MTMRMLSLISVRNGALLLSKVCPCSYKLVQAGGCSDTVVWFGHLPSTSFPNSSDPEQRCHSLPIPLPDSPLCVATQGRTHAMGLGWKGERKGREMFSFSVCTHEWVADVKLHHHTEACEAAASQTKILGQNRGKWAVGGREGKKCRGKRYRATNTDTFTRCPKLTEMNQGEMGYVTATTLKIGYAVY